MKKEIFMKEIFILSGREMELESNQIKSTFKVSIILRNFPINLLDSIQPNYFHIFNM
jgi:hypothetical protein